MATSDGVGLVFSSPVEHHTVELINERLETWTITLNSTIEYFTGTILLICYAWIMVV